MSQFLSAKYQLSCVGSGDLVSVSYPCEDSRRVSVVRQSFASVWPLVSRETGDTGHFSQNATPDLTLKLTFHTDPGPRPGAGPTACAGNVAVPDPSTGPDLGPMAL